MTKCVLLNGKKYAQEIESSIKEKLTGNQRPGLAIIQIGDNQASTLYTKMKRQACERIGFYSKDYKFEYSSDVQQKVLDTIEKLNTSEKIHGILVQLPLPEHLDEEKILQAINPRKDVDGFNSLNTNRLMSRNRPDPYFIPATPAGITALLDHYQISIEGKNVIIVGHSNIVGMPLAHAMLQRWATVTICHIKTVNLKEICRCADILISATGSAGLIKKDFIKPGATVIDVGINRKEYIDQDGAKKSHVIGDIDPSVETVAGALTPVPGGVGPMTIAMLLANTYKAFTLFD